MGVLRADPAGVSANENERENAGGDGATPTDIAALPLAALPVTCIKLNEF